MNLTYVLMVLVLLGQSETPASTDQEYKLTHCVVTLVDEAQVPARDAGVLKTVNVREGTSVEAGSVIAQLDDTEALATRKIAEAQYKAAREQAEDDVRVRAAQADAEITETEYLQGDDLSDAISDDADDKRLRRLLLAPRRAELQTDVARLDLYLAKLTSLVRAAELDAAESRLRRHRIECPLAGEVVRIYRNVGEWVNPGDAVVHVVRMDRLRIEGFVRASDFAPQEILGRPVTITVQVARGQQQQRTSTVAFASPIVETNGQYRIFVDVDNVRRQDHWVIRPGLMAEMVIHVPDAPAAD